MESKSEQQRRIFLYAVGHASRDITMSCPTATLQKLGIRQNDTNKYTQDLMQTLEDEISLPRIIKQPGGSMFNTAKNLGTLFKSRESMEKIAFTGFVTRTKDGEMVRESLRESEVTLLFDNNEYNDTEIATILCLIDEIRSDRTFIIHQEQGLSVEFINIEALKNSEYFMCSGYACQDIFITTNEDGTEERKKFINGARNLFQEAKDAGTKTIFSLSAPKCIDEHGEKFRQFIDDGLIDIVFGNESEFMHLYKEEKDSEQKDYEELSDEEKELRFTQINELLIEKSQNTTIVMTRGPENPRIYQNGIMEEVEIYGLNQEEIVNTNGAGDAFASGFLYGLSQGWEYTRCAELGHLVSLEVLMQEGTALSKILAKQIITEYLSEEYSVSTVDSVKDMIQACYNHNSEEKESEKKIHITTPRSTCRQEASKTQFSSQEPKPTKNRVKT